MPRYKKYDYSQSILLPVEFSKQIIPGTIEYAIDYMIEKTIMLIQKLFIINCSYTRQQQSLRPMKNQQPRYGAAERTHSSKVCKGAQRILRARNKAARGA